MVYIDYDYVDYYELKSEVKECSCGTKFVEIAIEKALGMVRIKCPFCLPYYRERDVKTPVLYRFKETMLMVYFV